MRERLAILTQAAEAADRQSLGPDLREEATSISHKLAGSLGMFGLPAGTELARELETAFERSTPDPLSPRVAALALVMFPLAAEPA